MAQYEFSRSQESMDAELIVAAPAAELLSGSQQWSEVFPEALVQDDLFVGQLESRVATIRCFNNIVENLPNPTTSLESAYDTGWVTERQLTDLYDYLADLLDDSDYARLALYLPFEFLPGHSWIPTEVVLAGTIERFRTSYLNAWRSLLTMHDVRANFIDGDVLEVEQRTTDLPRVVKAAHLLPGLIQKGLLSASDIIEILKTNEDPVLAASIADSLPALAEMGILTPDDGQILHSLLGAASTETLTPAAADNLQSTEKRQSWLAQQKRQQKVNELAKIISEAVLQNVGIGDSVFEITREHGYSLSVQALIEGLRLAVITDPDNAQQLIDQYLANTLSSAKSNDSEIAGRAVKALSHFYHLGLVSQQQLEQAGISLPNLSGALSANLAAIPEEIKTIIDLTKQIESDTKLSSLIYPVALVYGSRLKGYGVAGADTDLAVFVKPGIDLTSREEMRQLLQRAAAAVGKKSDAIVEFWLKENEEQLEVHDFTDYDPLVADSHWAHVLFGAAWVGNAESIKEIQSRLLPGYIYQTNDKIQGRNARNIWLEEIERDALQYRLLHRGYEQHFPLLSGSDVEIAQIDGSVFWDSGYRQLATKLFLEKVFLPKLNK